MTFSSARERFFDLSVDMLCVANTSGRFVELNEAWTRTLGWSTEELCAVPFTDFVHPEDVAATVEEAMSLGDGHETVHFENRYQRKDGTYVWLSWKATAAQDPDAPEGERLIFAVARDISDRKRLEDALQRLADHDDLTGLWARRRFEEEVDKQVARCRRYDEQAALFLLDLDHFKRVNDTYGHAVGDDLLRHVAATLRTRLRSVDSVARFGGDEFAVLLPRLGPDEAATAAHAIAEHLRSSPLEHDGLHVDVAASLGVAFVDRTTPAADTVMAAADHAMYDAKALGRDQVSGLRGARGEDAGRTRVFHCDDSEAYRRLLAEMLAAHADLQVVGGCDDHDTALEEIRASRPDVVVLDAMMGSQDTAAFVRGVRSSLPDLGLLVLSGLDACPEPLAEQTDGFIAKQRTFDDIAAAIRAVAGAEERVRRRRS